MLLYKLSFMTLVVFLFIFGVFYFGIYLINFFVYLLFYQKLICVMLLHYYINGNIMILDSIQN